MPDLTCHRDGSVTIDGARYSPSQSPELSAALATLDESARMRAERHLAGEKPTVVAAQVPRDLADAINAEATRRDVSASAVIREALVGAFGGEG